MSKKKTLYIIYSEFFIYEQNKISIGGIQNYILGLIEVFHIKYNIKIIQKSNQFFKKEFKDYTVQGFKIKKNHNLGNQLYNNIKSNLNDEDYIIWASDRIACKTNHNKTVSIQHGITFDFLDYENIKIGNILKKSLLLSVTYRFFQYLSAVKFFLRSKTVVCVDYNFLNWIRTILPRSYTNRAVVIPNFTKIPNLNVQKDTTSINILFARRFVAYRGVFVLCEVVKAILSKYDNVNFGIYGEGVLNDYIKKELGDFNNVTISSFNFDEAIDVSLNYDISIVPSLASEGTSLSLLESMACGCVPIASNIGGMTNILIDGFNGFLVNPTATDFVKKIEYLINNPDELLSLSKNARETSVKSFSFRKWKMEWEQVLK